MHRLEDERLLTGRGCFTDDTRMPEALWGVFVRSPHAHADIVAIDAGPAMAVAGAKLVLTGADLVADGVSGIPIARRLTDKQGRIPRSPPWESLVHSRVRHVGQNVALCVAQTQAAAETMAEALAIQFRELPVVVDVRKAVEPGAPELWIEAPGNVSFTWGLGDVEKTKAAFAAAAHIVEVADLVSQRVAVVPMEPRAALASYDAASGTYRLHTGNQGTALLRDQMAAILGVEAQTIIVTTGDTGGAFGIRNGTYPEYPALLVAARKLGRAVRWTGTRSEAFVSDAQARDSVMSGRLALDAEGRILAMQVRSLAGVGGCMHPMGYFIATANFSRCLAGPYRVPTIHTEIDCVLTNTVPTAPYRGAGRPEAAYLTERLMETAAQKLGLDPVEIRRRNLIAADAFPHDTAAGTTYDSGNFPHLLTQALEHAQWTGFAERRRASQARAKRRGIGIGMFVEISGGVNFERAKMQLTADGRVLVRTALAATGQGHETVMGLIAAEQLGIPFERIVVDQGSSEGFIDGGASSASRSTTMAGLAIRGAAHAFIDAAKVKAAAKLKVAAATLVWEDGRFSVPGTNLAIGLDALAADPPPEVDVRIEAEPTFPNGCHIAEVEIDPETGVVRLEKYTAIDDCGRVIAHEFAEGQVHGALAQGVGQVLMEHVVYDGDTGQLTSGTLMDYTLPRAEDMPRIDSHLSPVPARSNPLGVKGIGESGTVGALPSITNAVLDALRPLGVTAIDMPLTPERVWKAITAAQASH
jgi:aerobic carbon-monoxide dehydrogenase large subunit